ncbi:MAG: hypothetical protein ACKOSO_11865, partial [Actinomycetota bacterium]
SRASSRGGIAARNTPASRCERASAAGLGLAALAVALLGLALWLPKRRREARAFAVEDPGTGAVALRDVLAGWLADQGAATRTAPAAAVGGAIPRLSGISGGTWVGALERARYAPPDEARVALREARRETRIAVSQMRARLDRRERLRGAVRPRRGPRRDRG